MAELRLPSHVARGQLNYILLSPAAAAADGRLISMGDVNQKKKKKTLEINCSIPRPCYKRTIIIIIILYGRREMSDGKPTNASPAVVVLKIASPYIL